MKTLILPFLLLSITAFAADPPQPAKPVEIPAARHEAISQVMLAVQQAQIEAQTVQLQAQAAVTKSRKKVNDAQATYDALEESLRVEFHAGKQCSLTVAKAWDCESPTQPVTSPAAAPKK